MSNLLVQNIKHTNNTTSMAIDTSGQVTIRGESSATTTNLQQGLCKAWVNYTGISTTAKRDSFNISTLTDISTGRTTLPFTSPMANDDYSGYFYTNASADTAFTNFNNTFAGGFGDFTTANFKHNAYGSTDIDSFQNLSGIFGDLA